MAISQTLSSTTQTDAELGSKLDISLSGTWVGTAKLQRKINGTWVDTGDSWTANVETLAEAASPFQWRIDFTRTSGSLVVGLFGASPV